MVQLFFSGLLRHGGTSPLAPDGEKIEGWETRLLLVSYPATGIISGEAHRLCASLLHQPKPLFIAPEMTGAPFTSGSNQLWTTYATYAQDGWVGMDPHSHFTFMVRAALQQAHWVFQQLPGYY
jgi:hypothetical protein